MSGARVRDKAIWLKAGAPGADEEVMSLRRRLLEHLTYANAMATIAVFVALGGGAYASGMLPVNSVGTKQIRPKAVKSSDLGTRAVGSRSIARSAVAHSRLSPYVRRLLRAKGAPGPQGVTGERGATGATGTKGSDALGARRIDFSAPAEGDPPPVTVLDMPGLKFRARCLSSGGDVSLSLLATASEDSIVQDNFTVDTGTDPGDPSTATSTNTGNIQFAFASGAEEEAGGASASGSDYTRAVATVIVSGQTRTITLHVANVADAASERCSLRGTALPSS